MQTVTYHSIQIPNKVGEGAKLLEAFRAAGINLIAAWGYPVKAKRAVIDLAADDPKTFAKAAKKLGVDIGPKKSAFFVNGEDRPGAIADLLGHLAGAGISVHALQAICAGAGRYGALIQVDEDDFKAAKKVLSKVA